MRVVRLASEIDFDGWRIAARRLRAKGVTPETVIWKVERDLFEAPAPATPSAPAGAFTVPPAFVDLARSVILHRAPDRLPLLYRLLWRLEREPRLIDNPADPDVAKARDMQKAVSRAIHKMHAFVRFRLVETDPETYAAWFEPAHRVTEAAAPFFARRFTTMTWTILTPDACVAWDGETLKVSDGADPAEAPSEDAQEELWRTYYASIFNPARLNEKMMRQEMPKRYWRNLPEARLIPQLIETAQARAAAMVAATPSPAPDRVLKAAMRQARDGSYNSDVPTSLEAVAAGVQLCRRCDLWRDATQGVPGQGAANARLMFVGEQPGDQEDLAGLPFIGPAGQVFDEALSEAGVPRDRTYVTNAVKHFKHEPRGKRRIHKTPGGGEVQACRWWLDHERRLVRPRVIVALGATAANAVMGKATPIGVNRGKALQLPDQTRAVLTYHPSFLLRLPDPDARARARAEFIEDLRLAGELAGLLD
ncbi:UdgX family uracil-DNA binding protein [Caulobacter hibisci]|uniref:Type-4 uracil-DNA glycosylase n=1 Tax=Caulobacter hibisci TaxID=2035993 RepID=A0ABS0T0S7_9CAUL|nr:UdgX family uracil-DNA binding protein [Caulobacter hibisci]MBI1685481.1 UdgX family uracil-DNA binding protein [Caulobacter hibisci]